MANVINATSTGNGGLVSTGDDSGILNIQTNETTAITVDASQNVGIGLTPTAYKLSTNVASGDNTFGQYVGSSLYGYLQTSASYVKLGTNAATPVIVETNGTERMRIDSGGNLLVGQTSSTDGGGICVSKSVNGSTIANFYNNFGSGSQTLRTSMAGAASNTSSYHIVCASGADKFFVYGNGNVVNSNNSYGTLSDVKLKENIVDASSKLAKVMQLKVRNFNLKTEPEHKQIGFIAQELEQVFPALIDNTTSPNDPDDVIKSIKTSVLVPILVKAIQEQQTLLDTQAETINALTARIVALEQA